MLHLQVGKENRVKESVRKRNLRVLSGRGHNSALTGSVGDPVNAVLSRENVPVRYDPKRSRTELSGH